MRPAILILVTKLLRKKNEIVKYTLKSGGEGSRYELVAREVSIADFISDFKKNISISMQGIAIGRSGWIGNSGCGRTLSPLELLYL